MVKAIVGANWGDEGKGKITDMFAAESDVVIRFQAEQMQAIQLLTITESLRCTSFLREFVTVIPLIS